MNTEPHELETTTNEEFVVNQSFPLVILLIGFVLIFILVTMPLDWSLFLVVPGAAFLIWFAKKPTGNLMLHKELLRINCDGIYRKKELVTNWENFLQAEISEDRMLNTDPQGPVLLLYYRKEGHPGQYKMTIPFSELDDQSEEAVLEAIRRYYALSQGTVLPMQQPLQISNNE